MNDAKSGFRQDALVNYAALTVVPVSPMTDSQIAPLNYFLHSYGPASMPTMHLGWVFVALLLVIFIIVALLLVWAVLRKCLTEDPHSIGRVPILVWGTLTAAVANVFAVPSVSLAFFLLWLDRQRGRIFSIP